jgi:tripartite-type tricarboxylate transporter receptor subunit TctC
MPHVPYKGGGPAMQDLIGGHIPVIMPVFSSGVLAQHRAGRALVLAINSDARLKAVPDIPTSAEAGMPEMRVQVFDAIFAPAGTDAAALAALRAASARALRDPALRQDLAKTGAEPFTRADAESYIREETARWTAVIRSIGFTIR